jgi:hypothetical protein
VLKRNGRWQTRNGRLPPYWMSYEYYQAHGHPADPAPVALLPTQQQTARRTVRQVEDMLTRDGPTLACEVAWLSLFCAGLYAGG